MPKIMEYRAGDQEHGKSPGLRAGIDESHEQAAAEVYDGIIGEGLLRPIRVLHRLQVYAGENPEVFAKMTKSIGFFLS
jgi:hypothetical protein